MIARVTEIEISKLREECGVFGIYGHPEAARLTYLGLYALQHRGQESCGIVASDGAELRLERAMGHVSEAFNQTHLDRLRGSSAIGHVRYSTAGEVSISGRVLTAKGAGISNVSVTVLNMAGDDVGTAVTNTFGYFMVGDLPAGASYVIP